MMHRSKFLTVALGALFLTSGALAYDFVQGSNGFMVVECNDGTQVGCATSSGPFDCPTTAGSEPAFQAFCADHQGVNGVVLAGPTEHQDPRGERDRPIGQATGRR